MGKRIWSLANISQSTINSPSTVVRTSLLKANWPSVAASPCSRTSRLLRNNCSRVSVRCVGESVEQFSAALRTAKRLQQDRAAPICNTAEAKAEAFPLSAVFRSAHQKPSCQTTFEFLRPQAQQSTIPLGTKCGLL